MNALMRCVVYGAIHVRHATAQRVKDSDEPPLRFVCLFTQQENLRDERDRVNRSAARSGNSERR